MRSWEKKADKMYNLSKDTWETRKIRIIGIFRKFLIEEHENLGTFFYSDPRVRTLCINPRIKEKFLDRAYIPLIDEEQINIFFGSWTSFLNDAGLEEKFLFRYTFR